MINKANKNEVRMTRAKRIRKHLSGTPERPRLSVFKSAGHIYAQVIDDVKGVTLASASTLTKTVASKLVHLFVSTRIIKTIKKCIIRIKQRKNKSKLSLDK